MKTQLERELQEARSLYEKMTRSLWKGGLNKFFASEEFELFLEELDYLMDEIDEILILAASARNLIRESRAVRTMLLDNGFRLEATNTVQFLSNETAITEELLAIQELKDEKVTWIGRKLKNYNKRLWLFLEKRESGFDRVWMNWAKLPTADEFPSSLGLHLLGEFYEDDVQFTHQAPAAKEEDHYRSRQNGTQTNSHFNHQAPTAAEEDQYRSRRNGTQANSHFNHQAPAATEEDHYPSQRNGNQANSHNGVHGDSQKMRDRDFLVG